MLRLLKRYHLKQARLLREERIKLEEFLARKKTVDEQLRRLVNFAENDFSEYVNLCQDYFNGYGYRIDTLSYMDVKYCTLVNMGDVEGRVSEDIFPILNKIKSCIEYKVDVADLERIAMQEEKRLHYEIEKITKNANEANKALREECKKLRLLLKMATKLETADALVEETKLQLGKGDLDGVLHLDKE
jgi:hypothetical protein